MATWVTHLIIADKILSSFPQLDKLGFRVGNIAPDCNVENEDWTDFTPSREVTHWMQGARKKQSDCQAFCEQYILARRNNIQTNEEYSFLLGYYAHLITDAVFQEMIRNDNRVRAVWERLKADDRWKASISGMEESWDTVKMLIPKRNRMAAIYTFESEYLQLYPQCGYLTDILSLEEFPDYIDYLPHGAIVRKIKVMGYIPQGSPEADYIAFTREEYDSFIEDAVNQITVAFREIESN